MKGRSFRAGIVLLLACLIMAPAAFGASGLTESDFTRIGKGGFGDSANSYSWGVGWFKNDLYVGTVRHHLYSMMLAMAADLGDFGDLSGLLGELGPVPPPNTTWGSAEYAEAMRGEIWRYKCGKWSRVYQSPTFALPYDIVIPIPGSPQTFTIPKGTYPKAYGYRNIGTYKDYVYALGVGTWMPPMPASSVIRSKDGVNWEDVTGILGAGPAELGYQSTTNVRELVEWRGKVYTAASISLPGGIPGMGGRAVVYGSCEPKKDGWKAVSLPGFGDTHPNLEIYYLAVFNDCLYASTVNLETGFEVWKTNGSKDPANPGKFLWTQVIKNGFGDTWNQYGMTMQVFGKYLYVGTAVGAGMVRKGADVVGIRPIEVIRIDKYDNAQLVVGAYQANDPIEGGPDPRVPLSGIPAGFGNPLNVYTWHMAVYQGQLYLGTFDMSSFLTKVLATHPELLEQLLSSIPADTLNFPKLATDGMIPGTMISALFDQMYKYFGGGDVWRTSDGIHWFPVTLNGFNNPKNYGIRRLVPLNDEVMAVGTANPFTGQPNGGCEVWITPKPSNGKK
jgi:hypothetical protein